MTEDELRKRRAQAREFPETMEIMARIRAALAARMFQTGLGERDEREAIYLRVQTLDAMTSEMQTLLASESDTRAIEEYVKSLATTKPDRQV